MGYKGLIIKIQRLKASYDKEIADTIKNKVWYNPTYTKEDYVKMLTRYSDDLNNLLESEEYGMSKHFKY